MSVECWPSILVHSYAFCIKFAINFSNMLYYGIAWIYRCTFIKYTTYIECRTGVRNCTAGRYFKIKMGLPINGSHLIDIFKECLRDKHVELSRVYVFTVNIFSFNGNTIRSALLFYNKYYFGTYQIKIIR